jgi:hypothetical protein
MIYTVSVVTAYAAERFLGKWGPAGLRKMGFIAVNNSLFEGSARSNNFDGFGF